ncbi:cytosine deaminase [Streptomyces sp. 846.5]|nr:cytosine deaminase [Streptomyces sp. 846.5]
MPAETPPEHPAAPSGPALLLSGARQADGHAVDVRILGERIESVGPAGSLSAPDRLDLTGYLLLPAPTEPHAHLDEAFSATPPLDPCAEPDAAGSTEALQRRITEAALSGLGYGATVQRTHVRIGGVHGLTAMTAALQAARALHGLMELQVVPLPGTLTGRSGAEGRAALREALAMGAHAVGGCPEEDPEPDAHLDAVAALAEECRSPVDLHADLGDPRRLARLAAVFGQFPQRVTVGPCAALELQRPEDATRAIDRLASAGMAVVLLPQSGYCVAAGRGPGRARVAQRAPVRRLLAAGVAVAAGSGALRDLANPVGRVDPLEAAFLLAASGELDEVEAYERVSGAARWALGLAPVRVAPGAPADILAVRGDTLRGVLSGGHSRVVVHGGRVVSRTSAVREFADTTAPAVPRQGRSGPVPLD